MNRFVLVLAFVCLSYGLASQAEAGPFGLFGSRGGNCSSGSCGSANGCASSSGAVGNCTSGQCAVPLVVNRAETQVPVSRQVTPQVVQVDQGIQYDVSKERSSGMAALVRSYYSGNRRAAGSRSGVIASSQR